MSQAPSPPVAFRIVVREDAEDATIAALSALNTLGAEIRPADRDQEVTILAYFPEAPGLLDLIRTALGDAPRCLEAVPVPEVDWVGRFRDGFRPLRAGSFLVAPAWNVPPGHDGLLLVVDPGQAFGTGTHETTRLCLQALESLARRRSSLGRVADIGTGTGILAVAACLLGAASVAAVDNDPEAVRAAAHHARLNDVTLDVILGDGARPLRAASFDVIVSNIQAAVLVAKRDELASLAAAGAHMVLSGLLLEDLPHVREVYSALGPIDTQTEGEWAAVTISMPA